MIRFPLLLFFAPLFLSSLVVSKTRGDEPRFNRDILPILAENCFACHGFDEAAREADLRLDTEAGAIGEKGETGVVIPGQPQESDLIARIVSADADTLMPPPDSGKRLTPDQIATLRRWVANGAKYEGHWSFVLPRKGEPPVVPDADHPIDRFVQRRLVDANQEPAELADPATLIRRVSLDLTGLPPTLAELDAFESAWRKSPELAWAELVERLLRSPHYGERWGRWWLDQARYADSNGYSVDAPRSIWKYRDWVIEALNEDMPFDQFTIEQLAGDLLPNSTQAQNVATGFHRNTQINQEGGIDREQFRIDSVFDRVGTTGTVWLGLTIGCAQCHDHKFDPIEQKEFYQLFAFLNDQDEPTIKTYAPDLDVAAVTAERHAAEGQLKQFFKQHADELSAWEKSLGEVQRSKLNGEAQKSLKVATEKRRFSQTLSLFRVSPLAGAQAFAEASRIYDQRSKTLNDAPTTMVLRERSEPRKSTIFVKGDFTRPAEEVSPGTPKILHALNAENGRANRLDLARWITSPNNPLTARVIVNRVWQQYFGRGLVATENDFGLLGARPSHPDLLDWLAVEFIDRGWSMKEMHRLIVTSHTYRQSSVVTPEARLADPDNEWLGRQNRLRLDAEIIRDVALTASGLLASKRGGPPVFPPIPDGVMGQGQVKRSWKVSPGEDRFRRGLYTFVYRATPPPSLSVFDAPDGFSSCTRRNRSNTPLQSLTLMNDASFFEFAESLEVLIQSDGLEAAFRRCTSRRPVPEELAVLKRLDSLTAARTLLNLDETITRE